MGSEADDLTAGAIAGGAPDRGFAEAAGAEGATEPVTPPAPEEYEPAAAASLADSDVSFACADWISSAFIALRFCSIRVRLLAGGLYCSAFENASTASLAFF